MTTKEIKTRFGFPMIGFEGENVTNEIESENMDRALIDFLLERVRPGDTFLDVGANLGYFTIAMARKCQHVYAIEPDRENFDLLKKNIVMNDLKNVTALNIAVNKQIGFIEMVSIFRDQSNCGASSMILKNVPNVESVREVVCLQYWQALYHYLPDIVKTDTQGLDLTLALEAVRTGLATRLYAFEYWPQGDICGDGCSGVREMLKNGCDELHVVGDNLVMEFKE